MSSLFGKTLKKLREGRIEYPKTQAELGTFLDVGTKQVQRYEDGQVPGLDKIIKLSELFKCDFLSLATDGKCKMSDLSNNKNPDLQPGFKEIIEAINQGFNSSELVKTLQEVKQALIGLTPVSSKEEDIETFEMKGQKTGKNASEHT